MLVEPLVKETLALHYGVFTVDRLGIFKVKQFMDLTGATLYPELPRPLERVGDLKTGSLS